MADENRSAGTGAENPENKRVLVHADHVKVYFKGKEKKANAVRAVDDVSFDIMKGETFGVVGESGCGKSTLGRTLIRLIPATAGHIYLDGEDITKLPPERRPVSTVFQSYALFPHMTALQNVMYGLKFQGMKKKEAAERAWEYLEIVGLADRASSSVQELSGGQQQRVALARSMAVNPKVLLLDEPLSNLDAKLRIRMRDELKELQKKTGITMIFVTHDQEEAMALADKIAIMEGGRLIQMGAPREVYQNPASLFVMEFLGTADRAAMPDGSLIYFRPEDIRILGKAEETKARKDKGTERQAQNPDGRHLLTGTIVKSDYMGFYTQYFVKTEGGELLVREFEREYQNGDLVALELCGGKTF